jgi:hypothetical protein
MDGFADLITCSVDSTEMQIWKGNGGSSWTQVYSFDLPALLGIEDLVVADVDHSGYPEILLLSSHLGGGIFTPTSENKFKLLKDKVVPTSINATLLYPKGAECWRNNTVKFISWISGVPSNHASTVKIEYSTSSTAGPWTQIAAAAPNNGSYQWNVPASVNSSDCFIRITATDNVTSATAVATNAVPFNMGCTSSVTGVSESGGISDLSVFPNPSSGIFTIENVDPSDFKNGEIKVTDVLGRNVPFNYSNGNRLSVDLQNCTSGVYFMVVKNRDVVRTVKLVLEK